MIAFGLLIIGFATLYFDYGIWSTALIGFAWFQLGWLGHDWSHHTALPKSTTNCANYNDYLGMHTVVSINRPTLSQANQYRLVQPK
mmetsp:Transcript_2044/g.2010  ORF Transcript_2044/g.2010 Transcript_2044/m.2010 type:complete len:86 (-) Transcript_2044:97-354(-)